MRVFRLAVLTYQNELFKEQFALHHKRL